MFTRHPLLTVFFPLSLLVLSCGPQDEPSNTALDGPAPWPQVLDPIHEGANLSFSHPYGFSVEVGISENLSDLEPIEWDASDQLSLAKTAGEIKVFARLKDASRKYGGVFSWTYEVAQAYPPPAGQKGSEAIAMDDERIVAWASDVTQVQFGEDVDEQWQEKDLALGPAQGTSTDILCLGRGGSVVLQFNPPITDGPGYDFAVFENGINDTFLELASVEISSDGKTFVAFATAYLGTSPIDTYGSVDTTMVGGLAGKYRAGFGTPFDLSLLEFAPEVLCGELDLKQVRYVRIKDVIGDGSQLDSFAHPIYDPYPTTGSAGFDLDAIAVLNQGH